MQDVGFAHFDLPHPPSGIRHPASDILHPTHSPRTAAAMIIRCTSDVPW
jgi:hypothetical protein